MPLLRWFVPGAAALIAACSSSASAPTVPPPDHDIEGSWGIDPGPGPVIPGNFFVMVLSESMGTVSGTGSWAGEAGPSGSIAVSGTVHDDAVHLQIVRLYATARILPDTIVFQGTLASHTKMVGTSTHAGQSGPDAYVRVTVDPPLR